VLAEVLVVLLVYFFCSSPDLLRENLSFGNNWRLWQGWKQVLILVQPEAADGWCRAGWESRLSKFGQGFSGGSVLWQPKNLFKNYA
jgi:hypothetical protein